MAGLTRPTGKYERAKPVSNLGYEIYNAPDRAIMPGELETVEHEGIFHACVFNIENQQELAAYTAVMDRIINRSFGLKHRRYMEPTDTNPTFRIYLEWYEIRAFFPEFRPNGRYTRR